MTLNRSQPTPKENRIPVSKRKNPIQKFFSTPKGYVLILLVGLSVIASLGTHRFTGMRNEAAGVVTALVIDTIFAIAQKRKKLFADGGIITALIVSMVLSDHASIIAAVITTAIAVLSKHILKIKRKPIFNPAAVGLLIATFLFTSGQSWWGALSLLPAVSIVLLIIIGYLITGRVNKFPQVFIFMGIYVVTFLVMGLLHIGSPGDPLRTPFVNSALFMAFFMLTDPPTSPGTYKNQIIYSALASIISVGIYIIFGGLTYLLIGLLCANAFNALQSQLVPSKSAIKARQHQDNKRPVHAN